MNAVQAMKPPAAMKKKQNQDAMKATRSQDSTLCYIALVLWCWFAFGYLLCHLSRRLMSHLRLPRAICAPNSYSYMM